ncbi:MAG: hypothetical protein RRY78_04525, partial [Clostridia bacterium]
MKKPQIEKSTIENASESKLQENATDSKLQVENAKTEQNQSVDLAKNSTNASDSNTKVDASECNANGASDSKIEN